jgi:4-hydroxy-3-polyprenylbenzoate decarboxylase
LVLWSHNARQGDPCDGHDRRTPHQTDLKVADVEALASVVHRVEDIGASIASGSFRGLGMLVAPCSVRSLSEIASGVTSSLLSRAADVALKERRRVVLMLRETPLHAGHLKAMLAATEMGAIIAPPVPAFYARPQSLEAMVDQSVGRALDLFGLDVEGVVRWGEPEHRAAPDKIVAAPDKALPSV